MCRTLIWSRSVTTGSFPLSLHDALPIELVIELLAQPPGEKCEPFEQAFDIRVLAALAEEWRKRGAADRKSTRLNSSHVKISYAAFCLKKRKKNLRINQNNEN